MDNETLTRNYRCATCWGRLTELCVENPVTHEREWIVKCAKYPEHEGRVTSEYVDSRRKTSGLEASEVKAIYGDLLGVNHPTRSEGSRALYGDGD